MNAKRPRRTKYEKCTGCSLHPRDPGGALPHGTSNIHSPKHLHATGPPDPASQASWITRPATGSGSFSRPARPALGKTVKAFGPRFPAQPNVHTPAPAPLTAGSPSASRPGHGRRWAVSSAQAALGDLSPTGGGPGAHVRQCSGVTEANNEQLPGTPARSGGPTRASLHL